MLLALALALVAGSPPWLRPPAGWTIVESPPRFGALQILAMWREPAPADGFAQNLSLGVERFPGSLDAYVGATTRAIRTAARGPVAVRVAPFGCSSGPARLLQYDTAAFGARAHFEQLLIKRTSDVYVATYTRGVDQRPENEAGSALRAVCR